jgi:uncharacterized protein (DUF2384 family)
MERPAKELGNRVPISRLDSDVGVNAVVDLVDRFKYGIYD